jgi:hypothetical protein
MLVCRERGTAETARTRFSSFFTNPVGLAFRVFSGIGVSPSAADLQSTSLLQQSMKAKFGKFSWHLGSREWQDTARPTVEPV